MFALAGSGRLLRSQDRGSAETSPAEPEVLVLTADVSDADAIRSRFRAIAQQTFADIPKLQSVWSSNRIEVTLVPDIVDHRMKLEQDGRDAMQKAGKDFPPMPKREDFFGMQAFISAPQGIWKSKLFLPIGLVIDSPASVEVLLIHELGHAEADDETKTRGEPIEKDQDVREAIAYAKSSARLKTVIELDKRQRPELVGEFRKALKAHEHNHQLFKNRLEGQRLIRYVMSTR